MRKLFVIFVGLVMSGCIGTDLVDDATVPEEVEINEGQVSLLIGGTTTLTATYRDEFGMVADATFTWQSADASIASVDNSGVVTALAEGQTTVSVSAGTATSVGLLVTVRASVDDIAKVLISAPAQVQFDLGETLQLEATGWNVDNMQVEDVDVTWSVNDPTIAQVDANGLFTAVAAGEVEVVATIDGINSEPQVFTIGESERMADFVDVGGYVAEGSATLSRDDQGNIILELSPDFRTSFALGTFIYLSNTTNGRETRTGGLDLGEIRTGGAKTFNVTSVDEDVELDSYRYVIILCRPAGITFGFADFEN